MRDLQAIILSPIRFFDVISKRALMTHVDLHISSAYFTRFDKPQWRFILMPETSTVKSEGMEGNNSEISRTTKISFLRYAYALFSSSSFFDCLFVSVLFSFFAFYPPPTPTPLSLSLLFSSCKMTLLQKMTLTALLQQRQVLAVLQYASVIESRRLRMASFMC